MKKSMIVLLLLGLVHSSHVWAEADYLDERMDRLILKNSAADTSRTKKEKLFKYRCEYIEKYVGFDNSTSSQAIKHSCDKPEIGVTLYAGKDLGEHSPEKVAQYFKDEFAKNNINAAVFIKKDHPHGSSMGFFVNGESLIRKPVNPLKGIEIIKGLAADALMILYTEKRISEWPKGTATPTTK